LVPYTHAMLQCNMTGCSRWRDYHMTDATGSHQKGRSDQGGAPHPPGFRGLSPPRPVLAEIGPVNLLQNILRLWAQHREFRALYAELARHSDRELRDMGLERDDLARLAYAEAERRIVTPAASHAEAPAQVRLDPMPLPVG
jgi:uncharacterized protein YjiS (DUF1127 family)